MDQKDQNIQTPKYNVFSLLTIVIGMCTLLFSFIIFLIVLGMIWNGNTEPSKLFLVPLITVIAALGLFFHRKWSLYLLTIGIIVGYSLIPGVGKIYPSKFLAALPVISLVYLWVNYKKFK